MDSMASGELQTAAEAIAVVTLNRGTLTSCRRFAGFQTGNFLPACLQHDARQSRV
jgi:hypothetical protein